MVATSLREAPGARRVEKAEPFDRGLAEERRAAHRGHDDRSGADGHDRAGDEGHPGPRRAASVSAPSHHASQTIRRVRASPPRALLKPLRTTPV